MTTIAITGASGFIGRSLEVTAVARGLGVVRLVRNSQPDDQTIRWQLGDPLPDQCANVDVVVHLASATLVERMSLVEAAERDLAGSRILVDSVRRFRAQGRGMRFVFVSSQSAQADAGNVYGRSKWAIESMLEGNDEIIVRPGLVYGDEHAGVSRLLARLAVLPAFPAVAERPCIQPIQVVELAECLVKIATMRDPPRLFQLGAIDPMTFADCVRAFAARAGRPSPVGIPVSARYVRSIARLIDWLVRPRPSILERVNGLMALQPMETKRSLALLGCVPELLNRNRQGSPSRPKQ